jgi:alpha-2-macroglobulin
MKRLLFLLLLISLSHSATIAQDLYKSRQTGYYSYIFQLEAEHMKALAGQKHVMIDTAWLRNPVDSFVTGSSYEGVLPPGNYLMATLESQRVRFSVLQVPPFHPVVLNNFTDLILRLISSEGLGLHDAEIRIGDKLIPFDTVLQVYRLPQTGLSGVLEVRHGEYVSYYNLTSNHRFPRLRHKVKRVQHSAPLQVVWKPVKVAGSVPRDIFWSIMEGHPTGVVGRAYFCISRCLCVVHEPSCEGIRHGFTAKHSGYLVFSQPIYRPGDTVEYKAMIHSRKGGRPAGKRAVAELYGSSESFVVDTLKAYRKGGFNGSFVLSDSLPLRLDTEYRLSLITPRRHKPYIHGSFKYEDYVLTGLELVTHTVGKEHYRGKEYVVELSGFDDNRNRVTDARFDIVIRRHRVNDYFASPLFLYHDPIRYSEKALPDRPTRLTISDTLFPEVNIEYTIEVTLVTPDQRKVSRTLSATYYHLKERALIDLDVDSVRFVFEENGIRRDAVGRIYMRTAHRNRQLVYEGPLPYAVRLNPYALEYTLETEGQQTSLPLSWGVDPLIESHVEERGRDYVATISNPRRLPLIWFVYHRGEEIIRGESDEAVVEMVFRKHKDLRVRLFYLMGNQRSSRVVLRCENINRLHVAVDAPEKVFPGQETEIGVTVTDHRGWPVADADITAYSITAGFRHSSVKPVLYPTSCKQSTPPFNEFQLRSLTNRERYLDYRDPFWKQFGRPDTIAWFVYAYPEGGVAMGSVPNPDGINQVSPWLVRHGFFEVPRALYIDGEPVWLSWVNTNPPYAFQVSEGRHRFRFVTRDHIYTFDTLIPGNNQHTFLSIDLSNPPPGLLIENVGRDGVAEELAPLLARTLVYRSSRTDHNETPWFRQGTKVADLRSQSNPRLAGPVSDGPAAFVFQDSTELRFGFEPYHEYTATPGRLVMRSQNPARVREMMQRSNPPPFNLIARPVLTEETLEHRLRQNRLQRTRHQEWVNLSYMYTPEWGYRDVFEQEWGSLTPQGIKTARGTLKIVHPEWSGNDTPVLLFLYHHDTRTWRGFGGVSHIFSNSFGRISPGIYAVVWLFSDGTYQVNDSLEVRDNCISFHALQETERLPVDEWVSGPTAVLGALMTRGRIPPLEALHIINRSPGEVAMSEPCSIFPGLLEGYVTDENGIPLSFALMGIQYTMQATNTDASGFYRLPMPDTPCNVYVMHLGFEGLIVQGAVAGRRDLTLRRTTTLGYSPAASTGQTIDESQINFFLSGGVIPHSSISVRSYSLRGASSVSLRSFEMSLGSSGFTETFPDEEFPSGEVPEAAPCQGHVMELTGWQEPVSSLRSSFSDNAFWEPALRTDREGRATFQVTFPDDITAWSSHFLVTGGRKQSGYHQRVIPSYKPLLAQLQVPRFLTTGDSCRVMGVVSNYGGDTVLLTRIFEVDGEQKPGVEGAIAFGTTDNQWVTAFPGDTLWLQYTVNRSDGYFDGERRAIPLKTKGMEEIAARFYHLSSQGSVTLDAGTLPGEVNLQVWADIPTMIDAELQHLIDFKYDCNEQLASRLLALLIREEIGGKGLVVRAVSGWRINQIIRQLADGRNEQGLWGWWQGSPTSWWITEHVVYALQQAMKAGHTVPLSATELLTALHSRYPALHDPDHRLMALHCIMMLNPGFQVNALMQFRDSQPVLNHLQQLRLWELEQMAGMEVSADPVMLLHRRTFTEEIWFGRDTMQGRASSDELLSTITALRVLKNCPDVHDTITEQILNHLLRYPMHHRFTTYTRARWIDALRLYPAVAETREALPEARITTGIMEQHVRTFPFRITMAADTEVSIHNLSTSRLFVSTDQRHYVEDPEETGNGITLSTRFEGGADTLTAGEEITLYVDVVVERDASCVMIEVPIPAGCLYGEQQRPNRHETYREQFRDGTTIFCEYLPQGRYTFAVTLHPRFAGSYTMNPARAEMMYMPAVNGNTRVKKVVISSP